MLRFALRHLPDKAWVLLVFASLLVTASLTLGGAFGFGPGRASPSAHWSTHHAGSGGAASRRPPTTTTTLTTTPQSTAPSETSTSRGQTHPSAPGHPGGRPAPVPPPPAPPAGARADFVERDGTALTLQGRAYRFTGINIYMAASGSTPSSCGGELYPNLETPLVHMRPGVVIRFWAFQSFFVSHGAFDWTNLDQVLAIAQAHGDKVIPVLANEYDYCDAEKDLSWFESGYRTTVEPGDLVPYRQYVQDIVARYADNPVIAMWQLVNEGEAVNSDGSCNEPQALSALLGFSGDVGGLIHSIDRNHLVSLGTLAGYSGSGAQWCGAANADYQSLMASPGNDVCDYHDYGYPASPLGRPTVPDLSSAVEMCHADGKPLMVGENGIYADNGSGLAQRASEFTSKFNAQFQAGVAGELVWCWSVAPAYVSPDADPDYGISPGDPSLGLLGTS